MPDEVVDPDPVSDALCDADISVTVKVLPVMGSPVMVASVALTDVSPNVI